MKVIVPDSFLEDKNVNSFRYNDFCTIKLSYCKPLERHEITIAKNIMVIILNGQKTIYTDDKNYIANKGDIFFIKSGNYVMSEVLGDESKYESLVFAWDDTFINDFIKKYKLDLSTSLNYSNDIFQIVPNKLLKYCIDSFVPLFSFEEQLSENITKHKLQEVLLLLLESKQNSKFVSFLKTLQSDKNIKVKSKLDTNITAYKSIEEISKELGESIPSLRKEINSAYGITPQKWLVKKRLEKAKLLLLHSDKNISQVCNEVGYGNLSWFIKQFKKEFNITPKQFQKQQK